MNSIFIHVAAINNYKDILYNFINKINNSTLIDKVSNIFICISGEAYIKFNLPNNYIIKYNGTIDLFEFPTLELLKEYCINNPNDNVLYIHTKGVSTPDNQCINDWREYMSYFMIDKFEDCIKYINSYDTCGVDLREEPAPHYSGNFWWSKASHINTLPNFKDMPTILTERHKAEFWVCSKSNNHKSLWESNIPSHERHLHLYNKEIYSQ